MNLIPRRQLAAFALIAVALTATGFRTVLRSDPGRSLPVSVQSDRSMRAAGNEGPTSSILVPSSCTVTAGSATVKGDYEGGLAPEVYPRYGDRIDLYVFSRARPGYRDGVQVAQPFTSRAPAIGGRGGWTVTVPLIGQLTGSYPPVRCMVAAQPTQDFQGAP